MATRQEVLCSNKASIAKAAIISKGLTLESTIQ